jgi:hypothetical protein
MTTTTATSTRAGRKSGIAAMIAGAIILVLGASTAIRPNLTGPGWLIAAGVAALLFATGIFALATMPGLPRSGRITLTLATGAMTLFALAHFYAIIDEDRGTAAFTALTILSAVSLTVAGVIATRARAGTPLQRLSLLLTGIWPLATIPAGAAIGDVTLFVAIAGWGACWMLVGLSLTIQPSQR